jgi:hypothetical protein
MITQGVEPSQFSVLLTCLFKLPVCTAALQFRSANSLDLHSNGLVLRDFLLFGTGISYFSFLVLVVNDVRK